ncbi:MAG: D-alanyl-D-alanine carboxypeptidase/D-alanyl-D-alanine-endopeptidase [Sedimentitalea sp.]
MTVKLSRRILLSGFSALAMVGSAWAGAPAVSLRPRVRNARVTRMALGGVENVVAASGLSGQIGVAVADVSSGRALESLNGDKGLPPASVAKAVTALYALDALGAGHRFRTSLLATGPVQNGVLSGDLILAGGGDPLLNTDHLAGLASQLKAKGVREVRGDFKVYEAALPFVKSIDPGQPDQLGYSPAVSGIALNFNRVHFEWKRASKGYSVTMDARTERYRPDVQMAKMRIVNRKSPVYTYADKNGADQWTVAGAALGKGGSRWLPVRRPGDYAADVFRTLARSQGIVLKPAQTTRSVPGGTAVLAQHASEPLQEILRGMLRFSNNLTAEMVGLSASAAKGGRPGSLKDSASRMSRWAAQKYGMSGTRLVDHSGLGDASRMTARGLVTALVQVRKSGVLRPILKPVAMRDSKGRVDRSHPIKVNAKTGTLNFVSGLGGYMTAADGTEMAFAIFAADTNARSRIKRAQREQAQGARGWNGRAKKLQLALIERWGVLYGS